MRLILTIWVVGVLSAVAEARADPYRITTDVTDSSRGSVKTVFASAYFPHSAEEIWALFQKPEEFPSFIPRLRIYESGGVPRDEEEIYFELNLPWPAPDLWNVIGVTQDRSKGEYDWRMVVGNMNENRGQLRLTPEGVGTVVRMEVDADPGLFLPDWIITWGARRYLPKILRALGDRLGHSETKKNMLRGAHENETSPPIDS